MKSFTMRYGLRTMMILITIAAIVAAYFGNQHYRARLQEQAIEAIKAAGGQMIQNDEKDATRVLFRGTTFDDEKLKEMSRHLKNLPELEELDFFRTKITDDGIDYLLKVNQIDELYLFETQVTQSGIDELNRRMPRVAVKTEKPEPISTGMAAMDVYSHAMVGLDWTPDGSFLATGSGDGTIRFWDFETSSPAHQWKAHKSWAFSVAFSPDGSMIATGGGDNLIKLWDVETLELKFQLEGHTDDVHSVVFTPDGKRLASSGDDRTIRFWNLQTQEEDLILHGHTAQIPSIAMGPRGRYLASASRDNTVRLWDIQAGETAAVLPTESDDVNSVAFDSTGQLLASGDQGGKVKVWDVPTRKLVTQLTGHNGKVYRVAFDRRADSITSCGDDGIRVWNISTGESVELGNDQMYVSNLDFHPTRSTLASTNVTGELHLIDSRTGQTLRVLNSSYGMRGFEFE